MDSLIAIKNEYKDLKDNPLTNFGVSLNIPNPNDISHWICTLIGPQDTPYAGGLFYLDILFPKDYPKQQPEVKFVTPIYHINVNHINQPGCPLGHVCISTLNWWKPTNKIREVLSDIFALFYMGNPKSPYGLDRQTEMMNNLPLYENKIRYFTKKYANMENDYQVYKNWDFSYNPGNA